MVDWSSVAIEAGTSFLDRRDARMAAEYKAKLAEAKERREFNLWMKKEGLKQGWDKEVVEDERGYKEGLLEEKHSREDRLLEAEKLNTAKLLEASKAYDERWYNIKRGHKLADYKAQKLIEDTSWLANRKIIWERDRADTLDNRQYAWTKFLRENLWTDKEWLRRQHIVWKHETDVRGKKETGDWKTWLKKQQRLFEDFKKQEDYRFKNLSARDQAKELVDSQRTSIANLFDMVKNGSIADVPAVIAELREKKVVITPANEALLKHYSKPADVATQVSILKTFQTNISKGDAVFNPYTTFEEFNDSFSNEAWGTVFPKRTKQNVYNTLSKGVETNAALKHSAEHIKAGKIAVTLPSSKQRIWIIGPNKFQSSVLGVSKGPLRMSTAKSTLERADVSISNFLKKNKASLKPAD